ncbi:hypothetical protein [Micromonospora coerulea]|uniref:hypothetical protein n=1 Tax=Micromonospora coerulea TaxID=47856 RepID=UPI001F3CC5BF|nr:hypothetical protein [Micromonospora veneta]
MRTVRLGLFSSVIMAVVVMAGCNDGNNSAGDSAKSGGNAAATAPAIAASATASGAPATDADTKAACTTISGDIRTTMAKVAKAEKIGPPAGHSAVSAEYSAGAAGLYAHMFTASTQVNDAAKQVATAMSDLADTYATAPGKTPSKTALNTAVKQFQATCATS